MPINSAGICDGQAGDDTICVLAAVDVETPALLIGVDFCPGNDIRVVGVAAANNDGLTLRVEVEITCSGVYAGPYQHRITRQGDVYAILDSAKRVLECSRTGVIEAVAIHINHICRCQCRHR